MPGDLTAKAKAIWPEIVGALVKAGRCQPEDGVPIARYCESIALYRIVSKRLQRFGICKTNSRGQEAPSALLTIRSRLAAEQADFERAFGLNAKGRKQIGNAGAGKADALDGFLAGGEGQAQTA
jgi:P27 family predicted phage terminase small subunit